MEENSEAHMETNVSSTTEDVLDTQEVSDSHGNVETIVVVEEIEKEDVNNKTGECQPCDNVNQPKSGDASPQKVASPTPTQNVELVILQDPQQSIQNKVNPTEPQNESDMSSLNNDSTEQSELTKQNDLVDSSNRDSLKQDSKSNEEQIEIEKNEQELKDSISEQNKQISSTDFITDKPNTNEEQTKKPTTESVASKNNLIMPVDIIVERENSVDTNSESTSDTHEKEHNKSISRELKSLIKSAKESKIINECTQLTTKMRKSRTVLDNSNMSLNSSLDSEKIHGVRRNSSNSLKSNSSERSEKNILKRSMRSQNPEFVNKVKLFLNSVTKSQRDEDTTDDDLDNSRSTDKEDLTSQVTSSTPKKRKIDQSDTGTSEKLQTDPYCWRCHWTVEQSSEKAHMPMICTVCPRSFHFKCLTGVERNKINPESSWVCPECMFILHAESSETRSPAMKKISLGMLCDLLKFALERMLDINGVEPFMNSVDREEFPDYDKYVVHPMDLSLMKSNIAAGLYGSTEAFAADAQWILHNSIIFNTLQSKLTSGARALVRSCKAEMGEIEACPECYAAAHARRPTWFTDVCSTPHILLWAKLKGFPYWPAKGMTVNPAGLVDVRFFGAHDRAWVPAKDCYLYSEKDPNNFRTKRQDILDSMLEAEQHLRNISRKYGKFVYPPFKTQFDPSKLNEQLKMMIPTFEGSVRTYIKDKSSTLSPTSIGKNKSRSNSKSSKSSENVTDCDVSESEDPLRLSPGDGVNNSGLAKEDESTTENKDKSSDVEMVEIKDFKEGSVPSRKRRRSELEEAVITILDTSTNEKRIRVEENKAEITDCQEPSSSKDTSEIIEFDNTETKDTPQSVQTVKDKVTTKEDEPTSSSGIKEKPVQSKDKVEQPQTVITRVKTPVQTKLTKLVIKSDSKSSPKSTPNDKTHLEKVCTPKEKTKKHRRDRSLNDRNKEDIKSEKRLNKNKSLTNISMIFDKTGESTKDKHRESLMKPIIIERGKSVEGPKDKSKDTVKIKPVETSKLKENQIKTIETDKSGGVNNSKRIKDRITFDDNTSLAVIAREATKNTEVNTSGLPTITSVISLSTIAQITNTTQTVTSTAPKTIEITVEASPDSSIFTPTSTESILNPKDVANKLQRLRNSNEPMVGRVGVRAFARMTSPGKQTNDSMQVEIKAEPIDLDEPERHMEKMDLMKAFKLRPVNPASSLREVVVRPLNRKTPTKPPEVRPKAKKSFPQPKKPDDSQLNGKNSMVYIPIQPPMTQAPVRFTKPVNSNGPVANTVVSRGPASKTTANNIVNTVTTPLVPIITSVSSTPSTTTATSMPTAISTGMTAGVPSIPTIGQIPTTVHTVPLMTSVNGQWMFSLQPVMSVGGVDNTQSVATVNGLPERTLPNVAPLQSLPTLANNPTTEVSTTGEPPRLQQRTPVTQPIDTSAPSGPVPPPPHIGPLSAKINQTAVKLADIFRMLLEDTLEKSDDPTHQVASMKLQLEQMKWKHQQQLEEIRHNHDLTLSEMRTSFEKEKVRLLSEAKRQSQVELEAAIKHTKTKQWCANCSKEAEFYCCWDTWYCDHQCQRAHWPQHINVCRHQKTQEGNAVSKEGSSAPENRLQPITDKQPKNSSMPMLTIGGKVASRVYVQDQQENNAQKTSIIMSMVEDTSGNKTIKCVGTYSGKQKKPANARQQQTNIQVSNEDTNKKVVTSGGYLIVGSGTSTTSVMSPSRSVPTIQYYT